MATGESVFEVDVNLSFVCAISHDARKKVKQVIGIQSAAKIHAPQVELYLSVFGQRRCCQILV